MLVRDFLLTRFSLDTGTRPGPLNNATVKEYSAGKVKDSCKVMLVVRHKRAKLGPAICPMLPELHKFMQIYVTNIRPLFARPDVDSLFVTNDGISFKEGTIGRRLSAFVKKCGVRLGSRMAFVDMRKVITTEMLKRASQEERDILRRVLAHSEKTSRDWYTRPDLTDIGIQAVKIIQRLTDVDEKEKFLASSASKEEADAPSPLASSGKDVAGPSSLSPADVEALPPTTTSSSPTRPTPSSPSASTRSKISAKPPSHASTFDSGVVPPTPSSPTRPTSSSPLASTRSKISAKPPSHASTFVSGVVPPTPIMKKLTDMQKTQIKRTFNGEIAGKVSFTIEEAQKKMTTGNSILSVLSTNPSRVKQVVNFVNYLVTRDVSTSTPPTAEPPAEAKVNRSLDDFDNPSTRSSSIRRSEWDKEDTERQDCRSRSRCRSSFMLSTKTNPSP